MMRMLKEADDATAEARSAEMQDKLDKPTSPEDMTDEQLMQQAMAALAAEQKDPEPAREEPRRSGYPADAPTDPEHLTDEQLMQQAMAALAAEQKGGQPQAKEVDTGGWGGDE